MNWDLFFNGLGLAGAFGIAGLCAYTVGLAALWRDE
jgi:hypothetical protein